jgi:hypothetical protein
MIYSHTEEIIILYSSDGRVTLYAPESMKTAPTSMKSTPTTAANLERWRKWFDIINTAEDNPTLTMALDHAETVYDLIREPR